ncbi:class I SAM-dependent methyltransferase [Agromyces neolithicus]|uniref:Methyltransferase domain-containing protein n=1 Tax=Agromyces neolithicus TaxID=269420 RepID=A0ABN2LT77_9MICO
MGDTTGEPEIVGGLAHAATSIADLDELIWNPISTAAVARARPRFDELVLDACARDGASALPTAELVGIGGLVDAVDGSAELIDIARERAGDRMPQLKLHVADATTWETTGYDLVQCVLGVTTFTDLDAGTQHLIERAAPGGRVAITTWAPGALEPLREILTGVLPGDDAAPAPEVDVLHSPGSLAHWLTGLGLVGVRAENVQRHLDLTDEIAWTVVLGTGLRDALGELDDDAIAAVRARFLATLAERGATSVDLTTLIAVGHRPG